MTRFRWLLLGLVFCTVVMSVAEARVLRVEIDRRTTVLDGKSFGPYGSYELIEGTIVFGVDPAAPQN